ncbi:hypothetical protein EDB19DRAFT_1798561 [Suillus lakei]|nr:hypothetical protein EDB19DRAFT_1798561 [Suillus lakei]
MPSKNAKRKVWCRNLERARECKKQKTRICGVSESKITCQNTAFLTGTNSHLDMPSSPCKSVHANEVVVSTLRTWFGGSVLSSKEDDLERNVLSALDSIPLSTMRKFAIRSRRFIDAYDKGLTGTQAAWAIKKYHGHRVLPDSIMRDFDSTPHSLLS